MTTSLPLGIGTPIYPPGYVPGYAPTQPPFGVPTDPQGLRRLCAQLPNKVSTVKDAASAPTTVSDAFSDALSRMTALLKRLDACAVRVHGESNLDDDLLPPATHAGPPHLRLMAADLNAMLNWLGRAIDKLETQL